MANEIWNVAVDGAQLPGEHATAEVRELLVRHAGKQIRLWTPGMADWADPISLPQFQGQPAAPVDSPPPAAPRPRPVAASPSVASGPSAFRGAGMPMPISAADLQEQAGVFKALFDVNFNTLITPKLIKAVYIFLMVLLALGVAGGILASLAGFAAGFARGIVGLVVAVVVFPIVAVLYLALMRMWLEVIMTVFKIKEYAAIIAEKAKHSE